ncbi:restriction endonuclease subunit S [Pseudomonas aeruginosa]|uniref:restriction endonuclease subunit S n=1 Tax=Pseudomonas aeruginosa TaxID=287 RepID=UPI00292C0FE8|nr:restriction endonuclease subunit S [Pseudomonas aeruginosa]HEC1421822.1 restriction endonuclease subunit S [Pseudomonas aeruginosa]
MEVKPGYKQTEVGVIPEDWDVKSLGEFGGFSKGGGIRKDEAQSGDLPCIRYGEIYTHHNDIVRKYNSRISAGVAKASKRLRNGDILFAGSGETKEEIGKAVAFISDDEAYAGGDIVILSPRDGSSAFLGYALNAPFVARQKASKGQGDAVVHIGANALASIKLPTPSFAEQSAIATALSDMDALLDGLDRLIAKKSAIKQATMQQLLAGQTRLPGFSGEWEVKRLGDLAHIKTGSRNNEDKVEDGEYPFFVRSDDIERINSYAYDCEAILVPGEGRIGEIFHYINGKFDVHQRVYAITKFASEVSGRFVHLYMKAHFGIWAMQNTVKATVDSLRLPTFQNFEMKMPPAIEEQTAIATVLSDMDAEITALENRHTKTRALKQAMMQELLTGRTRLVKSAEKPDEEAAAQTAGRKANVHFLRSVLAAEIIDQLHDQPTFGHVKFEKMMFLAEHLCQVDTGSIYHRKAAGPYDNRALRSIDSQLQKQQWFEARKQDGRYQYVPLAKRGGHKPYFKRHFSGIVETLENILSTFKTAKTEKCEIVATLLAAWSDLLREKGTVSDEMIVHEVLHNWHEAKQRIPEDRWLKALGWMREKGFVPKGVTLP